MNYFFFSHSAYHSLLSGKLNEIKSEKFDETEINWLVNDRIKVIGSSRFSEFIQNELKVIASTFSGRHLIQEIFKKRNVSLVIKESPEKRNHMKWQDKKESLEEIQFSIPDCKTFYKTIKGDNALCDTEEGVFSSVLFHEMCHVLNSAQDSHAMLQRQSNKNVPQDSQSNQEEFRTIIGFDLERDKGILHNLDFQDADEYNPKFIPLVCICENLFLKELGKPSRCDHELVQAPFDAQAPLFSDLCLKGVSGEVSKRLADRVSVNTPQRLFTTQSPYSGMDLLPISFAAISQDINTIQAILDSPDIDKTAEDRAGGPLYICIKQGDVDTFRRLVKAKWTAATLDSKGRTPLRFLIEDYHWDLDNAAQWIEMADILLKNKQARTSKGADGKSAEDLLSSAFAAVHEAEQKGLSQQQIENLPLGTFVSAYAAYKEQSQ